MRIPALVAVVMTLGVLATPASASTAPSHAIVCHIRDSSEHCRPAARFPDSPKFVCRVVMPGTTYCLPPSWWFAGSI